jgi:hypothetical protein
MSYGGVCRELGLCCLFSSRVVLCFFLCFCVCALFVLGGVGVGRGSPPVGVALLLFSWLGAVF